MSLLLIWAEDEAGGTAQVETIVLGHGLFTVTLQTRVAVATAFQGHGLVTAQLGVKTGLSTVFQGHGLVTANLATRVALTTTFQGHSRLLVQLGTRVALSTVFQGHGLMLANAYSVVPSDYNVRFLGHGLMSNVPLFVSGGVGGGGTSVSIIST